MSKTPPESPDQPNKKLSPTPDLRVVAALDEIGLTYEIDENDAFYYFTLPTGEDRSHEVMISSKTIQSQGSELRAIYSIGLESDEPLDPRTANLLLRENAKHLIGSWIIFLEDGTHYAIFRVAVSTTADTQTIGNLINLVACTADDMEHRLTGLDVL